MHYMLFLVCWDSPPDLQWFYNYTEERNAIISRAGPTVANGFSALLRGTRLKKKSPLC